MDKYGMYIAKLYEDELKKRLTQKEFSYISQYVFRRVQVLDWYLMPETEFKTFLQSVIKPKKEEIMVAKQHIKNMGGFYDGYYKEESNEGNEGSEEGNEG